jgi:hypothetical protein
MASDSTIGRIAQHGLVDTRYRHEGVSTDVRLRMSLSAQMAMVYPQNQVTSGTPDVPDEIASLGLQAQIYFRNIVDRYPLLPMYLIHRLAVSNHRRAERPKHLRKRGIRNRQWIADAFGFVDPKLTTDPRTGKSPKLQGPGSGSDRFQVPQQQPMMTQSNSKSSIRQATESTSSTYGEFIQRPKSPQIRHTQGLRSENVMTSSTQHENTLPAKEEMKSLWSGGDVSYLGSQQDVTNPSNF